MKLSEKVLSYEPKTIKKDLTFEFGDRHDGAIEFAGLVKEGIIEVGYFYGEIKPKNILVLSSQVGCPSKCSFCELGNQPFVRNLTASEIYEQAILILKDAQRYGINIDSIPHKVNMAKSGEPLFNKELIRGLEYLSELGPSFKISTVFPKGVMKNFEKLTDFAKYCPEPVQIQISLISNSESYREKTAGIPVASFLEIRRAADYWKENNSKGRKINMSLILTEDMPCEVKHIQKIFPPEIFRFRFRNYVSTENGTNQGLITITKNRFDKVKEKFSEAGYEVGDWATPTPIEQRFGLASNVTRNRYMKMISGKF